MEIEQTTSGGLTNRNEDMSEAAKRGFRVRKIGGHGLKVLSATMS
jgi:hypothetical protein